MKPCPTRSMKEIIPDKAFLNDSEIPPNLTGINFIFRMTRISAEKARDLLTHMLAINPNERYTVGQCLSHPYVKVWFTEEEVNIPASGNRYNEEIETIELSLQELKSN